MGPYIAVSLLLAPEITVSLCMFRDLCVIFYGPDTPYYFCLSEIAVSLFMLRERCLSFHASRDRCINFAWSNMAGYSFFVLKVAVSVFMLKNPCINFYRFRNHCFIFAWSRDCVSLLMLRDHCITVKYPGIAVVSFLLVPEIVLSLVMVRYR